MTWKITGVSAAPRLLDSYSGAVAAYSFRSLSWAYGGPVVRVRRSSDDTEQDFTATQVADGTLTTFCGAGNGFVRTWYDQSGNSRHASQATNANQPIIVNAGTLLVDGGKPSISHATTRWLYAAWNLLTGSVPQTIIGVYGKGAGDADYISWGGGTALGLAGLGHTGGSNFRSTIAQDINSSISAVSAKSLVFNTFDGSSNTNNTSLWVNGVQYGVGTAGVAQSTTATDLYIGQRSGGTALANGISQEYIVYPFDLAASRAAIESNINAHYAIY